MCGYFASILVAIGLASAPAHAAEVKFTMLPPEALVSIEKQRTYVAGLLNKHLPGTKLKKSKADFGLLQKIIDRKVISSNQTWELQAIGICFGDALVQYIPGLTWWQITDEYGADPTLRYRNTSVQINALTMISKRIEEGEVVDVQGLADGVASFIKTKSGEFK